MSNVAQLYGAMGKFEQAAAVNKKIIALDRNMPMWWAEYIKTLLEAGNYAEANQALQEGLELHFDYAPLHALRGVWCQKMGQASQREAACERACRYDPGNKIYEAARAAAHQSMAGYTKKAAFLR